MSASLKKRLKNRLQEIRETKAKINIGKNGITPAIITEIDRQLENQEIIKIKFQKNFFTEDFALEIEKITSRTKALLVERRGKTIIIYRKSSKVKEA